MEPLSEQQQAQEDSYTFPYHWVKTYGDASGRLFLGYLDAAINMSSVESALQEGKQPSILDAGCGDGRLLKELFDRGARNVYGSDYSERAVAFARLLAPFGTYSVSDLTKRTEFSDEQFDTIFMIETLEHVIPARVPALLSEMKRILKPGGEIIVTVPSVNVPVSAHHYQHFSENSLRNVLEQDFTVELILGQDSIPFHILKAIYRLIDNPYVTFPIFVRYYNKHLWPAYFNVCQPQHGRRVMARARRRA